MKNELENMKTVDRLPAAYMRIAELNMRVSELEEIVKAVAYIGVDFGYGRYELEAGKIDDARTLMEGRE
tara:strand:- start:909 stop:1115 length:207 start_codon:yes stop_codon:yes gene_type:complete